MSSPYAAGPQALGYLYQVQYALLALLTADGEESSLIIEGLDDVELRGASFAELQQLKHHIETKRRAALTNSSTDLWKTLRVWADSLVQKQWDPLQTKLTLITTATAAKDSVPAMLRSSERDTDGALKKLVEIATTSKSTVLKDPFRAFNALKPLQQKQLVEAIIVVDEAPNIQDLETPIKTAIRWSVPLDKIDQVYWRLLGWWYATVAGQLMNELNPPIKWIELKNEMDEIISHFQRNSLPIEFARAEPDEAYYATQEGRMFVRQLDHLKLRAQRVRYAVKDYYRAFEQRTRWAGTDLLVGNEIENYEADLKEHWARFVDRLSYQAEFGNLEDDAACVAFGLRVLDWVENANFPIRSAMPPKAEYVTRGSYHIMADDEQPAVYWHPKFLDKLAEIVESTTV